MRIRLKSKTIPGERKFPNVNKCARWVSVLITWGLLTKGWLREAHWLRETRWLRKARWQREIHWLQQVDLDQISRLISEHRRIHSAKGILRCHLTAPAECRRRASSKRLHRRPKRCPMPDRRSSATSARWTSPTGNPTRLTSTASSTEPPWCWAK